VSRPPGPCWRPGCPGSPPWQRAPAAPAPCNGRVRACWGYPEGARCRPPLGQGSGCGGGAPAVHQHQRRRGRLAACRARQRHRPARPTPRPRQPTARPACRRYLPIGGSKAFIDVSVKLAYGEQHPVIGSGHIAAVQTLSGERLRSQPGGGRRRAQRPPLLLRGGRAWRWRRLTALPCPPLPCPAAGTGSCRLMADFQARFMKGREVYIPNPTWANHHNIWRDAGVPQGIYRWAARGCWGAGAAGAAAGAAAAWPTAVGGAGAADGCSEGRSRWLF
jgi:hypothetical protein